MWQSIKRQLINLPGWRSRRKFVVFESDDWGAIRTSSREALETLRKAGVRVDDSYYTLMDSLASEADLELLFDLLESYRDQQGRPAVITANCLMANPDFAKIEESGFEQYYFEDFRASLARYPQHQSAFSLWQEGIIKGVFHPQSHGREHLNISRWMNALKQKDERTHLAFKLGIGGLSGRISPSSYGNFLAAFDGRRSELLYDRGEIVREGLSMFQKVFGYSSRSFIAPNYIWNNEIEEAVRAEGVSYLQGSTAQRLPTGADHPTKIVRHYLGQHNGSGQRYLVRNCHFEPTSQPGKDWVDSCLREIEAAFRWRKPAIIGTHRVNFVGYLNEENRDRNLISLKKLLDRILQQWPAVEFISSDELGDIIAG